MKWINKGHQYDEKAKDIIKEFLRHDKGVFLYGAGEKSKGIYKTLENYDCLKGFIDASKEKQKKGYLKEDVISIEEFILRKENFWIVISTSNAYVSEIETTLKKCGFEHYNNFLFYDEFMDFIFPIIATYYYQECFVQLAQISLTERCTLKCEKCAHACYNVPKDSRDMTLEDACKSADIFFGKVDYIMEFVLIGGEPLLYKQLPDIIEYIGRNYRDKIGIFCITTNGTLLPTEQVIMASKKYNIYFRISNYSKNLEWLNERYKTLTNILEKNKVDYILAGQDGYWLDYGFESVRKDRPEDELICFFDKCKTPCREIRLNKYYYCVMARSVSDNLELGIGQDDYLNFEKLGSDYKRVILEYNLGFSVQGYLQMCKRCNGYGTINNNRIPVAIQRNMGKTNDR